MPDRITPLFSLLTGPLLLSMILLSVAHGLVPEIPRLYAGIAAWLAGVILLPGVKGLARLQILGMLGLGAAALAWAASTGRTTDWEPVLASNQALLAMLAAVSFLRLVTLPASAADDPTPRGPGALRTTLLGVHLFGSVINLSALMIIGDRLSEHRPLTPTQAQVLSRGFAMAAHWSPFFAAMGVALTNAPGAQLPTLALFGLPVAALALGYTAIELGRRPEATGFAGYPLHFGALWIPALLALAVLLIHQWRARHIVGVKGDHQRVRKQPRLAGEIADIVDLDTDFLAHFANDGLLQRFTGLGETGRAENMPGGKCERASRISGPRCTSTMMAIRG